MVSTPSLFTIFIILNDLVVSLSNIFIRLRSDQNDLLCLNWFHDLSQMTASDILSNLKIYQDLLDEIRQYELSKTKNGKNPTRLTRKIKSEYDFITLDLLKDDSETTRSSLCCRIVFEIQNSAATLKEVHTENKSDLPDIEKMVKDHKAIHKYNWQDNPSINNHYNEKILHYLTIGDSIARQALNCAHGDQYRPGYFSKVTLNEECIVLSQVNHMNSRSLDHKNDYSLRDLEFIIPLTTTELKTLFQDDKIGEMIVRFSDRSSSNNKRCGDAIQKQIEIEKVNYTNNNFK